jgi:hypothetical protein
MWDLWWTKWNCEQVFLRVLRFSPATIIPPWLHSHLSPPHEVCDSSDLAAHYHHLGPKLGALFLTRHFGWKQNKKVKIMYQVFIKFRKIGILRIYYIFVVPKTHLRKSKLEGGKHWQNSSFIFLTFTFLDSMREDKKVLTKW